MTKEKDLYDLHLEFLASVPSFLFQTAVNRSWSCGVGLFRFVQDDKEFYQSHNYRRGLPKCGCLTQIRFDGWTSRPVDRPRAVIGFDALTEEIRTDERIPVNVDGVTRDDLLVFAAWQRRLDAELPAGQRESPQNATLRFYRFLYHWNSTEPLWRSQSTASA